MKKLIVVILFSFMFSLGFSQAKNVGIVILPFKVLSENGKLNYLGKGIPDILITTLAHGEGINIVERDRISDIMKELEFTQTDLFRDGNAVKLGRLSGSRYIIAGTLTVIGHQVRMDSRIIDIESGKVIKGFTETAEETRLIFNSVDKLSIQMANYLTGKEPDIVKASHPLKGKAQMDICFLIDSTGSMDDEINVVRSKIREIMSDASKGAVRGNIRYAIVDYKDEGDDYVTRRLDFTSDIVKLKSYLNNLQAAGGGDFKEALLEGLDVTINRLSWSATGIKLIFIIADAPHQTRNNLSLNSLLQTAKGKKISINTIACSGIDNQGVSVFKTIASSTNGKFDFLTYKQQYVDHRGRKKDIIVKGDDIYETDEAMDKDEWSKPGFPSSERIRQHSKLKNFSAESGIAEKERSDFSKRGKPMKKSGNLQNNLDSMIKDTIEENKQRTRAYHSSSHRWKDVTVSNDSRRLAIRIYNPKTLKLIRKAKKRGKPIWIALSVKAKRNIQNGFVVKDGSVLILPEKDVPELSKSSFTKISKDPKYHESNGIMYPKRWFVQVKVEKVNP
ncbi:MAG: FlgO family outer membrane protein [Spirochaetota bacterium]|nr:FlgO family outer membrane protein [Spirochaetota bacterium]